MTFKIVIKIIMIIKIIIQQLYKLEYFVCTLLAKTHTFKSVASRRVIFYKYVTESTI
jgi:hypothetical protein